MLDPLSALSLAASITQFTDFGIRLVDAVHQLAKSEDGARTSNLQYEVYARDLSESSGRIRQALRPYRFSRQAKSDGRLERLGKDCDRFASELSTFLRKLKKREESGRWETFRLAILSLFEGRSHSGGSRTT